MTLDLHNPLLQPSVFRFRFRFRFESRTEWCYADYTKEMYEEHEIHLCEALVMIHKYLMTFICFIHFMYSFEHIVSSRSINPLMVSGLHAPKT